MQYRGYIASTLRYGVVGLVGFAGLLYYLLCSFWFPAVVCLFIVVVAFNNFFCGTHLAKTGCPITSHWVVPPFLKSRK